MTQYSSTNSWNANNNGNVNNNNRRNSNRVCAVSDYQSYKLFVENIFAAYYICRRNKRTSVSEVNYEIDGIRRTLELAEEVWHFRYVVSPSICFIIYEPTKREVFAANFRDRILDTWIAVRLESIFERHLPCSITANRKGKGTSYAINKVYNDIIKCTDNYTKDAWIYKFDLRGFFMSIDKRLLWSELKKVLDEEYNEWDKAWFMYVIEKRIFNRPQENCIRVCPISEWDDFPSNKSLFGQDKWHGLPIGDLLSQMLAGFFLLVFIVFLSLLGFEFVTNYADDFAIISPSEELILESIPKIREFLAKLGLTLHPHKSYIQHYTKGLQFLGAIIKPHRIYAGHRLKRKALKLKLPKSPNKALSSVNSYLGLMKHYNSRKIRKTLADMCFKKYKGKVHFCGGYEKMVVAKESKNPKKLRSKYDKQLHHGLQVYYANKI